MHTDLNGFLDYIFETFILNRMVISILNSISTYEWQQMKNSENRGYFTCRRADCGCYNWGLFQAFNLQRDLLSI